MSNPVIYLSDVTFKTKDGGVLIEDHPLLGLEKEWIQKSAYFINTILGKRLEGFMKNLVLHKETKLPTILNIDHKKEIGISNMSVEYWHEFIDNHK